MAKIDETQDTSTHESAQDADTARIDALVARFEKEDAASGSPAEDDEEIDDVEDDDDDRDDSDDSEDTDDDAGQRRAESDEDDEESDDEDTGAGSEEDDDAESEDDAGADDDDELDADDEDEDDADASDETKAALARHGADLTLEDIPPKFRPIVEQKLKGIDRAFTKAQMEATAFRAKEREYRQETTYRDENPDLVIVDMLRKGGADLFGKVNKLLNRIDPTEEGNTEESVKDAEVLLDEKIEMRRRKAAERIDAVEKQTADLHAAASTIEGWAREAAKELRVPMGKTIDKLLEAAILRKPASERAAGLTQDEVKAIVKEHADEHFQSVRAHRREASKDTVKDRTAHRNRPKQSVKTPRAAATPGARRPEKQKVDHSDSESVQRAMMRSARRIMPGVK